MKSKAGESWSQLGEASVTPATGGKLTSRNLTNPKIQGSSAYPTAGWYPLTSKPVRR